MRAALVWSAWLLLALRDSVTAIGTKAKRRSAKLNHNHYDDLHIETKDLSTEQFMSQVRGTIQQVLGKLVQDDNSAAIMIEPLKFFYSRNNDTNSDNGLSEDSFLKTAAECVLTHQESSGPVSKTIYLSLKDAEEYGKRLEDAKQRSAGESSTGGINFGMEASFKEGVELKCKSVVIEDESKKCTVCLYAEVLIPNKHVRYGHVGNSSVLECLNGYDNELNSTRTDRPYYINSKVRYHPVCIV